MKIFKGKIMPVKAVLSLVFALFAAASFVSCANDSGSGDDGNQDVKDTTAEKKALYAKISGTSWKAIEERDGIIVTDATPKTLSFSDTSVVIDGSSYNLDLSKDLYFSDEISDIRIGGGCALYIHLNNTYYGLDGYPFDENNKELYFQYTVDYNTTGGTSDLFTLVSSGTGSGGTESTSSVNGKYSYEATGSAISGAFTLSDGSWSYSGSKANISTNSGTYTVSGGKVTVKWTVTAGGNEIDNTETFSVTDNDDGTFTWKSENESVSLWFNLLFNVSGLELTFTKSE